MLSIVVFRIVWTATPLFSRGEPRRTCTLRKKSGIAAFYLETHVTYFDVFCFMQHISYISINTSIREYFRHIKLTVFLGHKKVRMELTRNFRGVRVTLDDLRNYTEVEFENLSDHRDVIRRTCETVAKCCTRCIGGDGPQLKHKD